MFPGSRVAVVLSITERCRHRLQRLMDEHLQREPVKGQDERREDERRGRGQVCASAQQDALTKKLTR